MPVRLAVKQLSTVKKAAFLETSDNASDLNGLSDSVSFGGKPFVNKVMKLSVAVKCKGSSC
jgi:hypothetical protein